MPRDPRPTIVDDQHFEIEVRRISALLWPNAKIERSPMLEGRERDAVVQTPDFLLIIEATTSRKKEKTEQDAKKTDQLVRKIRSQGFSARGILVTLHEPTADQEAVAKRYQGTLVLQTYDQFLGRLFDASNYLQLRLTKPFGSVQDPRSQHFALGREFYVNIPLIDERSGRGFTARDIAREIKDDQARLVMLADFGSGKSMSLREVFFILREEYVQKRHCRFPIYLNLRDHAGAKYPDEILERHARDLVIVDYSQLVKAWRGGFVDLILDGFDEFAATGWSVAPYRLRQLRNTMLEAVRKLISDSPRSIGILVAGRQHYFDSVREMEQALGIYANFSIVRIEPLSEGIAREIVKKYGGGTSVPDWVPSRALLLSYLAAKDFLKEVAESADENPRGRGWDALLRMISDREARQHPALDGGLVLQYIERLSTLARRSNDGLGTFAEDDLATVFQETCGFAPDDAARIFISRLPALAALAPESGRRRFIDPDIADAARAGDVGRFIQTPFDTTLSKAIKDAVCSIAGNGVDRLSFLADRENVKHSQIEIAAERASRSELQFAALDVVQLLVAWNLDYKRSAIAVSDVHFTGLFFEEEIADVSRITFWQCSIENLTLAPGINMSHLPKFNGCLIGSLDGIVALGDMPTDIFVNCDVLEFAGSIERNAEILATDLPIATKVLLTVLNKLFYQAGRGRKENAFSRGLDPRAQALVADVLALVEAQGFATPSRMRNQTVWLPKRDKARRVADIVGRPSSSVDPLIERVRNL